MLAMRCCNGETVSSLTSKQIEDGRDRKKERKKEGI
jgi:hypothetical protein